ncbi:MAG TPA: hypothetical protein VEQ16_08070 [Acidocella sp.]|jgi:hypothetical protein|nr:hypothetical protein [Acidocella sp.]
MHRPITDEDDTVKVKQRASAPLPRRSLLLPLAAGGTAILAAAFGGALLARRWLAPSSAAAPDFAIDTETEAGIDATVPCNIKLSYFALDRNVVVIDFADLLTQGLTLNRIAAFVEKAGAPRNRVLDDADLAAAIAATGDTAESYYYGHDYQASDLARFFALAGAENIALNQHELWLKDLLTQLGWLTPGAVGAIITVPAAGGPIAPDMRAVILHHEISHGAFYTVPEYRAYTESFWYSLTDADRAAFTDFLGRQGYDTSDTELMLNETQAYLVFTHDPRFFNAAAVGMTEGFVTQLREGFIAGMPDFWLKPMADATLPPAAAVGAACTAAIFPKTCLCYVQQPTQRRIS